MIADKNLTEWKLEEKMRFQLDKLISDIVFWARSYYSGHPVVSDQYYDSRLALVRELAMEFSSLRDRVPADMLQIIFSKRWDSKSKGKHLLRVQSLSSFASVLEALNFLKSKLRLFSNCLFGIVVQPKIDGLTLVARFRYGKLVRLTTRGDGWKGEIIPLKRRDRINGIPSFVKTFKKYFMSEVRGEVYVSFEDFERVKKFFKKNVSLRNSAAGLLRREETRYPQELKNILSFIAYDVVILYSSKALPLLISQTALAEILKKSLFEFPVQNFFVLDLFKLYLAEKFILDLYSNLLNEVDFQMDGVVIKLNSSFLRARLNDLDSEKPKWATAFKKESDSAISRLLSIEQTVGRTGKISYLAKIVPIFILGSRIKSVSISSYSRLIQLSLLVGDKLKIVKSGGVIPFISQVFREREEGRYKKLVAQHNFFSTCLFCGWRLQVKMREQYCVNRNCKERVISEISHFLSSLKIRYFRKRTVRTLFDLGIIGNRFDIFGLEDQKERILNIPGMGKKKFDILFSEVERSKSKSLSYWLKSFSIPGLGEKKINELIKWSSKLQKKPLRFLDQLKKIIDHSGSRDIENIPLSLSKSLIVLKHFFNSQEGQLLISSLKKQGINALN